MVKETQNQCLNPAEILWSKLKLDHDINKFKMLFMEDWTNIPVQVSLQEKIQCYSL